MSYDIKNLINTDKVFEFLEESFVSAFTSLKEDNLLQHPELKYEIFKNQADFDGTINVTMYADEDEAQKVNYALFRFIGGQVEPIGQLDVYGMRYSFEFLAFEDYRDDFNLILTTFAHSIHGNIFSMQYDDGTSLSFLVETNEFPVVSETIDANGADKFMTSNIIDMLFYANVIHADQVIMKLNGEQLSFSEVSISRTQVEPVPDLSKSYEVKMIPNKTSFVLNISGFYKTDLGTSSIFDWLMDETKLAESVRVFYVDGNKVKTGMYMINEARFTIPDGAIISYNLTLIPYKGALQTHYGLLVIGATGTNEYEAGDDIVLTNLDNHSHWEIEAFTTNQDILDYIATLDVDNEELEFSMPACDLKITAVRN